MSAHTQGPWRLDADEKIGDWQVLDAAAVYVVADRPSDHVSKNTMADARLIAAAPELLAALTQLRNAGGHNYHCAFDVGTPCSCGLDEALKVSAAAIAKARGGA